MEDSALHKYYGFDEMNQKLTNLLKINATLHKDDETTYVHENLLEKMWYILNQRLYLNDHPLNTNSVQKPTQIQKNVWKVFMV